MAQRAVTPMAGATMSWRQRFTANDGNSLALLLAARALSVASDDLDPQLHVV
jgi:hypothetical protein